MADWEGKSKGTPLGYRIFIFIIKTIGTSAAYLLLYPVVAWYVFFSKKSNKAAREYFKNLRQFYNEELKLSLFKTYYKMGQTLIDKIAIMSVDKPDFEVEREGMENLKAMDEGQTGGFLISAHIGNWEIAGHMTKPYNTPINIVLLDGEEEQIKKVMDDATGVRNFKTIAIKNDMSHMFKIYEAARRHEFICIHGDRFLPGAKTLEESFLGKKAEFPAGPFAMATKLGLPVSFVYGMKESASKYHFYCTKPYSGALKAEDLLHDYVQHLQQMLLKYPNQWFNFYPFWKKPENA